MRELTVFLMALALTTATAEPGGLPARRSRFLANVGAAAQPPLSFDCGKKSASVCLAPGSPGPTCCKGACVDTNASVMHCGNCNKQCKYGDTCCGGRCVNLLTDEKNCGACFNQCDKEKCNLGFCGYAG